MDIFQVFSFMVIAVNGFLGGIIEKKVETQVYDKWKAIRVSGLLQSVVWGAFTVGLYIDYTLTGRSFFAEIGRGYLFLIVGLVVIINLAQLRGIFDKAEIVEIEGNK